jgi:ABC-2 type transport system permease protein
MINAIRSEWIKLRSARSNIVLVCLAIGLPLVISTLISIFADMGDSDSVDVMAALVLGPCFICVIMAGVIGVLGIGQEYRHNTIRVTFTGEPRRSRVLAAKVIVTTVFGLGIGLLTQALCLAVSKTIFSVRDIEVAFFDAGVNATAFIGQVLLCGLFTLAGFGLGAILRQPAGAIPILVVFPLVVEPILSGLLGLIADNAGKWLPFQQGIRLAVNAETGSEVFSRLYAGLYFGGFVAVLVAIGWVLVEGRDA